MSKHTQRWLPMAAVSFALCLPALVHAQETDPAPASVVRNMRSMKFGPLPGLPTCLSGAVQSGDPARGPSYIVARMATGCAIPRHWLAANESVMVVTGTARINMKGAMPQTLIAGGFALFASRQIHQIRCAHKCTLFIHTDAAFGINYIDRNGNALQPDAALRTADEIEAAM